MSQCTAHRKGGGECRAQAVAGTNVCRVHGGNAPQVRRRAAQRLLEASDSAAALLVKIVDDERLPVEVRLKAARDLLDRAGLGAKERVELSVAPAEAEKAPWEALLPRVLYMVDRPDEDTADSATTPTRRPQAQLEKGVVPPADSPAAEAMYRASKAAPDPEPPAPTVRVDGPRPRVRRRRV